MNNEQMNNMVKSPTPSLLLSNLYKQSMWLQNTIQGSQSLTQTLRGANGDRQKY